MDALAGCDDAPASRKLGPILVLGEPAAENAVEDEIGVEAAAAPLAKEDAMRNGIEFQRRAVDNSAKGAEAIGVRNEDAHEQEKGDANQLLWSELLHVRRISVAWRGHAI